MTSHAMFARLRLQRLADSLSSRYVVVERTVLHRSPIVLTLYAAGDLIDDLTLSANKARQSRITKEMLEIASGAEALGKG